MQFFTRPTPPESPFVGRELELQRSMHAAECALVTGQAQLLNLVGVAGAGKSRLAAELIERVWARSFPRPRVLRAVAPLPGEREPLEQLLHQRYASDLPPSGAIGPRLSVALRELVDEGYLPAATFMTARLLGLVSSQTPLLTMITEAFSADRSAEVEMLVTLLEHDAEETPMIVVIEDLHFCSQRTIDVVHALGRQLRGRVLMITTSRENVLGRPAAGGDPLVTLRLGKLPESALLQAKPLARVTDSEIENEWFDRDASEPVATSSLPPPEQSGTRLRVAVPVEQASKRARAS